MHARSRLTAKAAYRRPLRVGAERRASLPAEDVQTVRYFFCALQHRGRSVDEPQCNDLTTADTGGNSICDL
jgi:hypothetical protein